MKAALGSVRHAPHISESPLRGPAVSWACTKQQASCACSHVGAGNAAAAGEGPEPGAGEAEGAGRGGHRRRLPPAGALRHRGPLHCPLAVGAVPAVLAARGTRGAVFQAGRHSSSKEAVSMQAHVTCMAGLR